MNKCANTELLNAHMDKEERREKAFARFEKTVESELLILNHLVENLKKFASSYEGFDFSEDLEEMINDSI